MKGMMFTELLEFVEAQFGMDTVDEIIDRSGVTGAYTQAGNYPHEEIVQLVVALGEVSGVAVDELQVVFGRHLFGRIAAIYGDMRDEFTTATELIARVDNVIHPNVQKLYPDAKLPTFTEVEHTDEVLVIDYLSDRPLAPLAKGLMFGAGDYYDEEIDVAIETLPEGSNARARFTITRA